MDISAAVGSKPSSVSNSFTSASNIQETSESAIWLYDATTSTITVQYVNADGCTFLIFTNAIVLLLIMFAFSATPTNYIMYSTADQALVITGDVSKFTGVFGNVPVVVSTLTLALSST
jgi:hypothetical protein